MRIDKTCPENALQEAADEYVQLMKTEAEVDKKPVIKVEDNPAKCLPASW